MGPSWSSLPRTPHDPFLSSLAVCVPSPGACSAPASLLPSFCKVPVLARLTGGGFRPQAREKAAQGVGGAVGPRGRSGEVIYPQSCPTPGSCITLVF